MPVIDKRRRPLYACDVMAGKALQERFNAYMKSKGHPVELDCGDRVIHWNSHDAVHGQQRKNIAAACKLFRAAYEAKGLLPAQRDPAPSPAERDIKQRRLLAVRIEAAAKHTKDPGQKRKWAQALSETIRGHETFTPGNARENAKPVRDPCADAIAKLLALP